MSIGIYKIENKITNEIYIGSSVNIEKRLSRHKCKSEWKLQPNSKLYLDFQKYGLENFQFSVIENCEKENLHQREDFYIQSLKPQYNVKRAYNPNFYKTKERKVYQRNYQKTYIYKKYHKSYMKNYRSRLCNYNGKSLTINALMLRFRRQGVSHPFQEAKKYLCQ